MSALGNQGAQVTKANILWSTCVETLPVEDPIFDGEKAQAGGTPCLGVAYVNPQSIFSHTKLFHCHAESRCVGTRGLSMIRDSSPPPWAETRNDIWLLKSRERETRSSDSMTEGGESPTLDGDAQALVDAALAFVAHHSDGAHLLSAGHVGPTVGLEVKPLNVHHPHLLYGFG